MSGKSKNEKAETKKDNKKDIVRSLKIKLGKAKKKIEELESLVEEKNREIETLNNIERKTLVEHKAKLRKVGMLR